MGEDASYIIEYIDGMNVAESYIFEAITAYHLRERGDNKALTVGSSGVHAKRVFEHADFTPNEISDLLKKMADPVITRDLPDYADQVRGKSPNYFMTADDKKELKQRQMIISDVATAFNHLLLDRTGSVLRGCRRAYIVRPRQTAGDRAHVLVALSQEYVPHIQELYTDPSSKKIRVVSDFAEEGEVTKLAGYERTDFDKVVKSAMKITPRIVEDILGDATLFAD